MSIGLLGELTWDEAARLQEGGWIAILPLGATEAHGPHLPLRTDGLIAEAMSRAGAEILSAGGLDVLILPTLDYAPAPFAESFAGTISVAPSTVSRMILDIGCAVGAQRALGLVLASAHFDPAQVGSLRELVSGERPAGCARIIFPDVTRRRYAERLTEEFRSGACHAGQYETSILMAEAPEHVREERRAGLSANPASLTSAIREGKRTFEEAGGPEAYFGFPADASKGEGAETVRVLGSILADVVSEELELEAPE